MNRASAQTALPGFDADPEPTDSLFFALQPDAAARQRLSALALELRAAHGLSAQPLDAERFHVTLCALGEHAGLPPDLAPRAAEVAASLTLPAFRLEFDRVTSFGAGQRKPLVLRGGAGLAAVVDFQRALAEALLRAGLGRHLKGSFTPHLTLLYGDLTLAEQPVPAVGWQADELVLVHSLLGRSRHVVLGRWALGR